MRPVAFVFIILNTFIAVSQVTFVLAQDIPFSRLVVYDVRGVDQEETVIILEQQGQKVKVWLKNYLGERSGNMPYDEYRACFDAMRAIKGFALKKEYQGHSLRAHAAKGMITLAWKDSTGKQIQTIKYYAPENTLDDFRQAFNSIWGLSRYAILSLNALESQKIEYLEDAVYFLAGNGWITFRELNSLVAYHVRQGNGMHMAQLVWKALDQQYPATSEFSQNKYLRYCVKKSLILLGSHSLQFLDSLPTSLSKEKTELIQEIRSELKRNTGEVTTR